MINGGSKPPPYREFCEIHCFLIWDDVGIVPYKLEFDELFTPSGAMRQLPREGAHTVSLLFAVSRLFICLPLEGGGTAKP